MSRRRSHAAAAADGSAAAWRRQLHRRRRRQKQHKLHTAVSGSRQLRVVVVVAAVADGLDDALLGSTASQMDGSGVLV